MKPLAGIQCPSDGQVPEPLLQIRGFLNWRTAQELLLGALESNTHRGAPPELPSIAEHFAEALTPLINEIRHWTSPDEAEEIVTSISPWLDPSQRSVVLLGRLMLMALPTEASKRLINEDHLFRWWELLPRGANPRYSLMWIALPARAAKVRWASGVPWTPDLVLPQGRLSTVMDIVAGSMCLPVDDGKSPALDIWADDCQWAFLGGTLYRLVAKFLVYSLEPLESSGSFPAGGVWAALELLCRRLTPCMIHTGTWTWHVRTFLYELARCYYVRVCRERFKEPGCLAHESYRMTSACDVAFVRLVRPLLVDSLTLQSKGGEHVQMQSITMSLPFIARLSLLDPSSWAETRSFLEESVQDLEDPMSVRHNTTLQLLGLATPLLAYSAPGLLVDAAHLALPGINATDPMKTLLTAVFFAQLFIQVPTRDLSLQDLPSQLPGALMEAMPVHPSGPALQGADPGELKMCTSTLPDLCHALLERFLEYIQSVPKPSKLDAMAALDLAGPRVLSTALFLATRQADDSTAEAMVSRLDEWLARTLVPDAIKGVRMVVGALSLARLSFAERLLDSALKRLPGASLAALGESEALWHLGVLGAAARFAETRLPPRRKALEGLIEAALRDERKPVRKAGAKLCRRVLMGLTAPFCRDLTGDGSIQEAVHRWSGARGLSWGSAPRPLEFHTPQAEELAFAQALCRRMLEIIKQKASNLGSDEDIYTALTLAKSLVRGVACLYPDEQATETAKPLVTTLPNEMGPVIVEELANVLLTLCPQLGAPSHPFDSGASSAASASRPKLLCKAVRMIVGLVKGERRPEVPDLLQIRGFEGSIRGRISQESTTLKVHFTGAWRDIPRVWYNWEVLLLMNRRLYYRPTGFKFQGTRKKLAELICLYSVNENSGVSGTAAECLQAFLRVHYSAKRELLEDTLLPLQEKTIAGAAQDKTTPERSHLAEAALQGFATTTSMLFVGGAWRRGLAESLRLASTIVRTIHAFTEENQSHVDVNPAAVSMQFDLLSKWCNASVGCRKEGVEAACKGARALLELLKQPGTHWRTRVCSFAALGAVLRLLHFNKVADADAQVLERWIGEAVESLAGSAPPQMAALAVAELSSSMRSALRDPSSPIALVLKKLLPSEGSWLDDAAKTLSGLHQGHVGADLGAPAQADTVQCVVNAAVGKVKIPQLSWTACPSGLAWARHATFFQTYVAFRARRGDTALIADLERILRRLQSQPKSEAEDHVLFIEILAGTLRAARRFPEEQLQELWKALGPIAAEELRVAEEENIRSWQFLLAFALSGISRRLRPRPTEPLEAAPVLQLSHFLAGQMAKGEGEASSHAHANRLRLLQVLLVSMRRRRPAVTDDLRVQVLSGLVPTLQEGVSHPYKQVHEESAKAIVAALLMGMDHHSVITDLREWVKSRALELSPRVLAASAESPVTVACEGLVYCFIHALLGRRLMGLALESAELLLATASAEDHELRGLALLALGCLGQSHQRGWEPLAMARTLAGLCQVPEAASAAQRARHLEAAAGLVCAGAMRHHFVLHGTANGEGLKLCRDALITLLQERRVEVRSASQTALAPLLGLDGVEACRAQVKSFAALGSGDSVDSAVHGLGAMLLAAGSLGVPPWLGGVVEALARVGQRPEAKKEVEHIVQAFLKQQQESRDLWRRCQARLTVTQMDLLRSRQGTLSYYA